MLGNIAEMNAALDGSFKFQIGDLVESVGSRQDCPDVFPAFGSPRYVMVVIAQLAQRCSGGIQLLYECRAVREDGSMLSPITPVHEVEIRKVAP